MRVGNIIGVVLLVVVAFIAGYLIGRARPAVVAAEAAGQEVPSPTIGEDGLSLDSHPVG
ncbi:MAG: hypothetical protein GX600_03205 [Dehalococcoidia bacterium]|nr:hypothetical protein [Dehalococcoidia bacterium]